MNTTPRQQLCPMCGGNSRKLGYSGTKSGNVTQKYQCKICARHFIEGTVYPLHIRLEYLNERINTLTTVRDELLKNNSIEVQHEEGDNVVGKST
jgi:transposase-like protein